MGNASSEVALDRLLHETSPDVEKISHNLKRGQTIRVKKIFHMNRDIPDPPKEPKQEPVVVPAPEPEPTPIPVQSKISLIRTQIVQKTVPILYQRPTTTLRPVLVKTQTPVVLTKPTTAQQVVVQRPLTRLVPVTAVKPVEVLDPISLVPVTTVKTFTPVIVQQTPHRLKIQIVEKERPKSLEDKHLRKLVLEECPRPDSFAKLVQLKRKHSFDHSYRSDWTELGTKIET